VTALNPTGPRLDLMRAIAAGDVHYDQIDHVWYIERTRSTVTAKFNDLCRAGLARQVRFTDSELTDAGRAWLATHDKEDAR